MPFGVYDPGGDFQDDPEVTIEHLFLPWEDIYLPSLADADAYAVARNRAVLVTLEPWTWTVSERTSAQALQLGIAEGAYDANVASICDVLGRFVSPVTLRWGHEMDDDNGQFLWAGWDPATYVSAFRRVIDTCRASAPNINVMWSPLGDDGMEQYYPGDTYVDLVGVSVFGLQAFDQLTYGRDRSFRDIFWRCRLCGGLGERSAQGATRIPQPDWRHLFQPERSLPLAQWPWLSRLAGRIPRDGLIEGSEQTAAGRAWSSLLPAPRTAKFIL
jgi:beta-mannanase